MTAFGAEPGPLPAGRRRGDSFTWRGIYFERRAGKPRPRRPEGPVGESSRDNCNWHRPRCNIHYKARSPLWLCRGSFGVRRVRPAAGRRGLPGRREVRSAVIDTSNESLFAKMPKKESDPLGRETPLGMTRPLFRRLAIETFSFGTCPEFPRRHPQRSWKCSPRP